MLNTSIRKDGGPERLPGVSAISHETLLHGGCLAFVPRRETAYAERHSAKSPD